MMDTPPPPACTILPPSNPTSTSSHDPIQSIPTISSTIQPSTLHRTPPSSTQFFARPTSLGDHYPQQPQHRSSTASRQGSPAPNQNFQQSSSGGSLSIRVSRTQQLEREVGKGSQLGQVKDAEELGNKDWDGEEQGLERRKRQTWGKGYLHEHDSIRNDYSHHYVSTGQRPQNYIRGAKVEERYPKLSRLLDLKHTLLSSDCNSLPPTFLNLPPSQTPLRKTIFTTLDPTTHKFDVILLTPPFSTTFDELKALDLGKWSHSPGFVWLWVGDGRSGAGGGVGLERGRELLGLWGYRRCEDIVWLKTNKTQPDSQDHSSPSLFTPSIEHCLMGIRGTVRRSTDPWFVHCNVDTDVMVWEGDELGTCSSLGIPRSSKTSSASAELRFCVSDPLLKPPELQSLIEAFCQGTRRLHLYGSPRSLRRGWLTVGIPITPTSSITNGEEVSEVFSERSFVRPIERESQEWTPTAFDPSIYVSRIRSTSTSSTLPTSLSQLNLQDPVNAPSVPPYLPYHPELDALRPKSPPARAGQASSGGLGRGRGAGLGVTKSLVAKGASGLKQRGGGGIIGGGMEMKGAVFLPPSSAAPTLTTLLRSDYYGAIQPDAMLHPIEFPDRTTMEDGRIGWISPRFAIAQGQGQERGQGASFGLPLHRHYQYQVSYPVFQQQQQQQQQFHYAPNVSHVVRPPISSFAPPPQAHFLPSASSMPFPTPHGQAHSESMTYHQQQQTQHPLFRGTSYPSFDPHRHQHQQQQHWVPPTGFSQSQSQSQYYAGLHYEPQQQLQPQQVYHPHHQLPPPHPSVPALSAFSSPRSVASAASGDGVYPVGRPGL